MAGFVDRYWLSDGTGTTRSERMSCDYRAYVPDALTGRPFVLDGPVAADVADAEAAVRRLNETSAALVDTEALARLLLRAEAAASSRIEGLEVGARRLLHADAVRDGQLRAGHDVTAEEVLGNIDAMLGALSAADPSQQVTAETILDIHRRLLAGTTLADHAGRVRTEQNWIGGSAFNPCGAAFVPPPPESVPAMLDDLAAFCNDDALPAVAQAAIVHAQFETVHPFVDGNGRVGRALVHLVMRRRGLAPWAVPPVSLVLATMSSAYIAGLTAYRYEGASHAPAAHAGVNAWVATFAGACIQAVRDAESFERDVQGLIGAWRERLAPIRRNSSVDLLLGVLPGAPILTVSSASTLLGRSFRSVNSAVARLEEAGVLKRVTIGRRNRAFEAPEVIDAFTGLERRRAPYFIPPVLNVGHATTIIGTGDLVEVDGSGGVVRILERRAAGE
ncbi:MAG: Fic family protein [Coriobacteriia bacterium]